MQKQNPRAKSEKEANDPLEAVKSVNESPQRRQSTGYSSARRSRQPENNGSSRDHS